MEVSPQALPLSWTFLPNIGHAASSLSSPGDQHSGALVWTFFPVVCCFRGESWNTCSGVPQSAVHWMFGAVTLTQQESFQRASFCCSGWGPREDGFLCFFHMQLLSSFPWLQHLQRWRTPPPGHWKCLLWENKRGKSKQNNFYYFPSYHCKSPMFIFYSSLSPEEILFVFLVLILKVSYFTSLWY